MVKLFLLGATGWVGSAAAYTIAGAHPDYEYVVLLCSEAKANDAKMLLPERTRFVIGDFNSFDLIASEAAASDIVMNWASSDLDGLNNAVLAGLKRKGNQCYLIHTSGTGLLTHEDMKNNRESRENNRDNVEKLPLECLAQALSSHFKSPCNPRQVQTRPAKAKMDEQKRTRCWGVASSRKQNRVSSTPHPKSHF